MSNYLESGLIVGTFGINGELKVLSDASTNRFVKGNILYLGKSTKALEKVEITNVRMHKGLYLVEINHLNNINLVEKYINYRFYIDRDEMNDLEPNQYYFIDLIGLAVKNENDEVVGKVVDMIDLPAHAVIETLIGDKKVLVPFVNQYIGNVTKEYVIIKHLKEFL